MSENGYIPLLILSPTWEQTFAESIVGDADSKQLVMPPSKLQDFVSAVTAAFDKQTLQGEIPVILTSAALRPFVRSVIERVKPNLVVMAQTEIHPKAKIKTVGQI
jgi:flagellar biosynthesis protein FlhA